ncbi:hypothetical protein KSX_70950 [Ktedonospora formicarum]|uniref:Uncharacterized protein n=1 Tax=Ktedonospora formicarum TaxID=2778364 RepID=A0A8J3I2L2_9CHLR|nr:chromate transporter [Ktedonospora formicarum]GHO48932.1 hypothetical protein KSX_70950 [Ktedonospora formicarum]
MVLLVGLPVLRLVVHAQGLALFDMFFRVGSLVFGGGHVVLPLLQREVVPAGWVNNDQFLAGYGAAFKFFIEKFDKHKYITLYQYYVVVRGVGNDDAMRLCVYPDRRGAGGLAFGGWDRYALCVS